MALQDSDPHGQSRVHTVHNNDAVGIVPSEQKSHSSIEATVE